MRQYNLISYIDDVALIIDNGYSELFNMKTCYKLTNSSVIQSNTGNCQLTIINDFNDFYNSIKSLNLSIDSNNYPDPLTMAIEYIHRESRTLSYFHLLEKYDYIDNFEKIIKNYFDVVSITKYIETNQNPQRHYLLKKKLNFHYKTVLFRKSCGYIFDKILVHDKKCYLYNWYSITSKYLNLEYAMHITRNAYFNKIRGLSITDTQNLNYENTLHEEKTKEYIDAESKRFLDTKKQFDVILNSIVANIKPYGYVEPVVEKPVAPIVKKAPVKKPVTRKEKTIAESKPKAKPVSKSKKIT